MAKHKREPGEPDIRYTTFYTINKGGYKKHYRAQAWSHGRCIIQTTEGYHNKGNAKRALWHAWKVLDRAMKWGLI